MSNWTEHLRGLAKIEKNVGKSVAFNDSASRIDELESKIENLEQQLKQQWVSVDDGLPEKFGEYLTYNPHSTYSQFQAMVYSSSGWQYSKTYITHWMPIKPPTK